MSEHVTEEEKIIICCNLLGGALKAIEEKARLAMCCGAAPIPNRLATRAIEASEKAFQELQEVLHLLTHGPD